MSRWEQGRKGGWNKVDGGWDGQLGLQVPAEGGHVGLDEDPQQTRQVDRYTDNGSRALLLLAVALEKKR